MKICIVTPDFAGMVRNGGIGTACRELAKGLITAGNEVTILFTQIGAKSDDPDQRKDLAIGGFQRDFDLVFAEEWGGVQVTARAFPEQPHLWMSWVVHEWLKARSFNIVFFMDWQGAGFYALSARRCGRGQEQHGAMVVICHSPTLWSDLGNAVSHQNPVRALTYFIERRSVELADIVVSPSNYLLGWMRTHGFELPASTLVVPNLLDIADNCDEGARQAIEVIVFFGRLEYRKGLILFCNAIDKLIAKGRIPKRIVFLGKLGVVGSENAALYLGRRTRHWPMPVEVRNRLGRDESLRFLRGLNCLTVVPSTQENSPYTVYECLAFGVPVVARDVGGISELYAPQFRQSHLFEDNPSKLAELAISAMDGRLPSAHLSFSPNQLHQSWCEEIPALAAKVSARRPAMAPRSVSISVTVCLVHFRRPDLLMQALKSLAAQTYTEFDVILIDDGSEDDRTQRLLERLEPVFQMRKWTILRTTNGYVGRARNLGARLAKGDFLLFMDDDNVATPGMIEALAYAAARSGADIVTSFASVFNGKGSPDRYTSIVETYLPVGGALGYALSGNAISDTNALIRRELFERLGGFSEDYGLGHEDFELFLRAALQGADILVVPESLYWYRRLSTSMISVTPHAANRARSLRPFLEHFGPDMAELLVVAHGMADGGEPSLEDTRETEGMEAYLKVLAGHDPDSQEAIDAAAAVLAGRGSTDMAVQLLRQLPSDQPEAELRLLRAESIMAVDQDNAPALGRILRRAKGLSDGEARDLVSFSARIASTLGRNVAIDVLRLWTELWSDELEPRLLLIEALASAKRVEEAFRVFTDALAVADRQYRSARPDIGAAVARQDFDTGLTHYERHGRHENAPWPEERAFRDVVAKLSDALRGQRLVGSPEYIEQIRLGFAAFRPSGPVQAGLGSEHQQS